MVENFRPGVADKLGIGYQSLCAQNPSLVYASVSGFGQTGPGIAPACLRHAHPAGDVRPDGRHRLAGRHADALLGEAVSDVVSGLFASWGVLAALLSREKTGKGTHVDVSMFDATLSLSATLVARYAATGLAPRRVGNRHPSSRCRSGAYRAADGVLRGGGAEQQAVPNACRHDRPAGAGGRSAFRRRPLTLQRGVAPCGHASRHGPPRARWRK
ncbi:CoA transferase [Cupriavidus basilensis]